MPNVRLAMLLWALAMFAVAVNAYNWAATGEFSLRLAGPALALLAMLVVLPWAAGSPSAGRPGQPSATPTCHKCGAPTPAPALPSSFCLACGAFPRMVRATG